MKNPHEPKFQDYANSLDGKHKVNNYDELLKRAQLKKADFMKTKAWVQEQGSIDDFVSVKPSNELALIDHYNSMPDVEVQPEVAEFWHAQQDALGKLDLQGPQTEYLSAYKEWQELVDIMDQKKRDELGVNNFDVQEEQAKRQIKEARKGVKEAKRRAKDVEYEVTPMSVFLGGITGSNKDAKTFMDAKTGVRKAKRNLKEAQRKLQEIRERKEIIQEHKDELGVKEHMALDKMNDALRKNGN